MISAVRFLVLILILHQVSSDVAPAGDDDGNYPRSLKISKNLPRIPIFTPANLTIRCDYNRDTDPYATADLSRPILLSLKQAREPNRYSFNTLVSIDIVYDQVMLNKEVDAAQLPDETRVNLGGDNEDAFLEATWLNPSSVQDGHYKCLGSFINKDTGGIEERDEQDTIWVDYNVNLDSVSEAYEELMGKQ